MPKLNNGVCVHEECKFFRYCIVESHGKAWNRLMAGQLRETKEGCTQGFHAWRFDYADQQSCSMGECSAQRTIPKQFLYPQDLLLDN